MILLSFVCVTVSLCGFVMHDCGAARGSFLASSGFRWRVAASHSYSIPTVLVRSFCSSSPWDVALRSLEDLKNKPELFKAELGNSCPLSPWIMSSMCVSIRNYLIL